MTVLIAWASLSVGVVMGAMWRSLCEKQSRNNTDMNMNMVDGSLIFHRSTAEPQPQRRRGEQQRPAC
jgi:hypothetical protein